MNASFSLTVWAARVCGSKTNCVYPDEHTATDADGLKRIVANDHTFIGLLWALTADTKIRSTI